MKHPKKFLSSLAAVALVVIPATRANADVLTLTLNNSFSFSGAFGLAFDGTNLHVSTSSGLITEINPNTGVATGNTTTNPRGWSALAWDGTQLVGAQGNQVTYFDKTTGANQRSVTIPFSAGLVDGLDIGPSGEIWWSRDVGPVDRFSATGTLIQAGIPIPPGAGFSGVEYINDIALGEILVVVNDAFSPRRLSVAKLDGTLLAEASFANSRYEDLAFDGTYLYAADFVGGRIDKYGVKVGDVIIGGGGGGVPDNGSTLGFLGVACVLMAGFSRRKTVDAAV